MTSAKDAMSPAGFEGTINPAPQNPQAAYNASQPLINSSGDTGTRQAPVYPQQTGGMSPRTQGTTP